MKLKQLYDIFNSAIPLFEITIKGIAVGGNNFTNFENLKNYRKSIQILENSGLFKSEIEQIHNSAIFSNNQNSTRLVPNEGKVLQEMVGVFDKIVRSVFSVLAEISNSEKHENYVSIKFPFVKDFDDLSKISRDLHTILNQVIVNDKIKGKVEIINVENGSIWFDILLGTELALIIVGELAWASAVIFKKIQEGRIIEQHVKSLKIKNDSLSDIQKAQKTLIDEMVDNEAKFLHNKHFNSDDNEQLPRIKHSIKLLSKLLGKGAEIHPALNAPEEVSNLFPDINKLELVESKIKKLTS